MNDTADQSTLLNVQGEQPERIELRLIRLYDDIRSNSLRQGGVFNSESERTVNEALNVISLARHTLVKAKTWHENDLYRNGDHVEQKAWREQMALLDEAIKALGVKP